MHVVGEKSNVCQEVTCAYPLDPGIENAGLVSWRPHRAHAFLDEGQRGWGQPGGCGMEGLDDRGRLGGVRWRENDAEMDRGENREGYSVGEILWDEGRGGEIDVV